MKRPAANAASEFAAAPGTIAVPEALLAYLRRRCVDPDGMVADVVRRIALGGAFPLSSRSDEHGGLAACSLHATTVVTRRLGYVEATIATSDWVVRAGHESTDLTLNILPGGWRASLSGKLLCGMFDIPFLPRDLVVGDVVDEGAGGRIRCQPVLRTLDLSVQPADECLSGVCGRVSGPNAGF